MLQVVNSAVQFFGSAMGGALGAGTPPASGLGNDASSRYMAPIVPIAVAAALGGCSGGQTSLLRGVFAGGLVGMLSACKHALTSRRFQIKDVIYGIEHYGTPEEIKLITAIIERAKEAGAKSIGLELAPAFLPGKARRVMVFTEIAEVGQKLGMVIIPLLSDSLRDEMVSVDSIKEFITDSGSIDRWGLEQRIKDIEGELQAEGTRSDKILSLEYCLYIVQLDSVLGHLRRAKSLLDKIDYDMDSWARAWTDVMKRADAEMKGRIRSEHPDIVVIGSKHVKNLKGATGYESRILSFDFGVSNTLDAGSDYANFTGATVQYAETHDGRSLALILRRLISFISEYGFTEADLPRLLDSAIRHEPQFFSLVLRAFSRQEPQFLNCSQPGNDIEFLKLPIELAMQRVIRDLGL